MSTGTVEHHLVTTSYELIGYHIVQQLGVVRGITVRSRSVVGNDRSPGLWHRRRRRAGVGDLRSWKHDRKGFVQI
jgi:hypothetical protein